MRFNRTTPPVNGWIALGALTALFGTLVFVFYNVMESLQYRVR